jgi:hypothetical protein
MKKIVLSLMVIAVLGLTAKVYAQKKDSLITLPTVTVTTTTNVNSTVSGVFKKTFPDAQNLEWYKLNKNYLAKFISEDMKRNAWFSKNGYMNYYVSFGDENNLPEAVRQRVTSAYEDYKITKAVNVKFSNREVWVINLEGLKQYLIIRVEGDEMEQVQKINKS